MGKEYEWGYFLDMSFGEREHFTPEDGTQEAHGLVDNTQRGMGIKQRFFG